jgi:hypothetical protein
MYNYKCAKKAGLNTQLSKSTMLNTIVSRSLRGLAAMSKSAVVRIKAHALWKGKAFHHTSSLIDW